MYELSIKEYKKCLNLVEQHVEEEGDHDLITFQKAGCLNNIALCYMNMQMPGKTIHFAT